MPLPPRRIGHAASATHTVSWIFLSYVYPCFTPLVTDFGPTRFSATKTRPRRLFAGPYARKEASLRTQAKQHAYEEACRHEGRMTRARWENESARRLPVAARVPAKARKSGAVIFARRPGPAAQMWQNPSTPHLV